MACASLFGSILSPRDVVAVQTPPSRPGLAGRRAPHRPTPTGPECLARAGPDRWGACSVSFSPAFSWPLFKDSGVPLKLWALMVVGVGEGEKSLRSVVLSWGLVVLLYLAFHFSLRTCLQFFFFFW